MGVNKFDKRISVILENPEGRPADDTIKMYDQLLGELSEEIKVLWKDKGIVTNLIDELIDDTLQIATRSLEESEWDDLLADRLITLFGLAEKDRVFRAAMKWADESRKIGIRVILRHVEGEKHLFFINEELENLEGMAYRLLKWINARHTLIQEFKNRLER